MTNTPHINLLDETGFAKTVLMPGDPLRAKKIAEDFLEDAVLVNNVRGIQGYTGFYKGIWKHIPLPVSREEKANESCNSRCKSDLHCP